MLMFKIKDYDKIKILSFSEFVNTKKLPNSISNYLINAVAMAPNQNAYEVSYQNKLFFALKLQKTTKFK